MSFFETQCISGKLVFLVTHAVFELPRVEGVEPLVLAAPPEYCLKLHPSGSVLTSPTSWMHLSINLSVCRTTKYYVHVAFDAT